MPQTFNQDAYLEALQPPVFVAGGRTHRGLILSADEWLVLVTAIDAAEKSNASSLFVVRLVCDTIFPPGPRRWWWRSPREPSVADLVAQLPLAGQLEATRSFAEAQRAIQDGTPSRATIPADGTR